MTYVTDMAGDPVIIQPNKRDGQVCLTIADSDDDQVASLRFEDEAAYRDFVQKLSEAGDYAWRSTNA